MDESEVLIKEMEEQKSSDKEERFYDRLHETFTEH